MPNPFEVTPPNIPMYAQELRQQMAKTSAMETAAAEERLNLTTQEQFQRAIQQVSPSLPVMERLSQIANAAMSTGRFGDAEKVLGMMSRVEEKASLNEQHAALAAKERTDAAAKETDFAIKLLSGVTDESSFNAANELYRQEFGKPSPLAGQKYSPQLVEMAKNALTKQRPPSQVRADDARAAAEYARAYRDKLVGEAQAKYLSARREAVEKKMADNVKAGGKLAEVKPAEIALAKDRIKVDHPNLSPDEKDLAAREVAADAKEIQLREHGSYADALAKALQGRSAQFSKTPGKSVFGIQTQAPKESYTSGSESSPFPLPRDKGSLKAGKYYQTAKGVARWTGKSFTLEPVSVGGGDDEDDDAN